jgi:hypothetical protein
MILWTVDLTSYSAVETTGFSLDENGIKTVSDVRSYRTSMAAILASTFS